MDRMYYLRIRETRPARDRSEAPGNTVDLYAFSASGGETLVATNVAWDKVASALEPMLWARKASTSESVLWNEKELKSLAEDWTKP